MANTGDGTVTALRANLANGAADLLNLGTAGAFPSELVLDPFNQNGRQVYVSNRGSNVVSQFRVSDAINVPGQPLQFGALQGVDQNGNLVSSLQANPVAKALTAGTNPRGLAMAIGNALKTFLYTANSGSLQAALNSLSGFALGSIDPINPPLTHALLDSNPANPGTPIATGGVNPTQDAVVVGKSPNPANSPPQFLFVTNRNSDSISAEAINLTDGTLTTLPTFTLSPGDQPFSVTGATFTVP